MPRRPISEWTGADWLAAAVVMQRRANVAGLMGRTREVVSYCRRRDFCARIAKRFGALGIWTAIDAEAERVVC